MKTIIFNNIAELVTLEGASKKNGRLVKENDLSIIKKAAMVVQDGIIKWVGSEKKIPKEFTKLKSKKNVSLENQIVMPGFVDSHTHLIFAGDRSLEFEMRNQGKSYQEIARAGGGIVATVAATCKASHSELLELSQERLQKHLKQGVATVEIKSGYGLNLKDEIKILEVAKKLKKVRVVTTYLGPHAVPAKITKEKYFESVLKDLKTIFEKKLARRADIFIEDIAFNVRESEQYLKRAQELGFDLVAHTNQLTESDGMNLAVMYGAKSVDHVNFISDSAILTLAKSNTTAVVVPGADFYLKNPYAPARKLIDAGARVAVASNFNPGSCPTQDLQFVGALARLECKMTYFEVLSGFTLGGAYALGLEKEIGSLEVGKHADFITTNTSLTNHFYTPGARIITGLWRSGTAIS